MANTEQFVLVTDDCAGRTSNVSTGLIRRAIGEIDNNSIVALEKCCPLVIDPEESVYAMSYDKDALFAVHITRCGKVMRVVRSDCPQDAAADMMCSFFESQRLPDMSDWECQEMIENRKNEVEMTLVVDSCEFRHFDISDVLIALQNIRDGKSEWLQLHSNGVEDQDCGCIEVIRDMDAPEFSCKVEWNRGVSDSAVGYRTVTSDYHRIRQWLTDRMVSEKYPEPDSGCTQFSVADYFDELLNNFLNGDER